MMKIDVHTHGIGGYDTRTTRAADILGIARIQGSTGVGAILPTVYPQPLEDMRRNLAAIKEAMEIQRREASRNPRGDALILGAHLEGPFLNPTRRGALDPVSFLPPKEHYFRALTEGLEDVIRIITLSPEVDGALQLIRLISDRGVAVSMGHSDATYNEAEAGFQHGAQGITHLFNAMAGYFHREPGLPGFGLLNPHVYVEVIADPYHLHPKTIEMVFKMKDPSRIIIVSDSVKATLSGTSPSQEGLKDRSGRLEGGSMTVTEATRRLVNAGFHNDTVTRCITANPAAYLGL